MSNELYYNEKNDLILYKSVYKIVFFIESLIIHLTIYIFININDHDCEKNTNLKNNSISKLCTLRLPKRRSTPCVL